MKLEEARVVGFEATPPLHQGVYPPVCRVGELFVRTKVLPHGVLAIAEEPHGRHWIMEAAKSQKGIVILGHPILATSNSVVLCIAEKNRDKFFPYFKNLAPVLTQPFFATALDLGKGIPLLEEVFRTVPEHEMKMREEICAMILACIWLRSAGSMDAYRIRALAVFRYKLGRNPKRIGSATDLMKIFLRRFGREPPKEVTL